jgi:folate-binding protein YgfZ
MSTNTLEDLQPGQWRDTVLTTGKGRVVDVVTVISLPEHLILLTSPGQEDRVAEWLDMYIFLEDCTLESMNQDVSILSLLGPDAQKVLEEFLPDHVRPPDVGEVASLDLGGITVTTLRTNPMGVPGYDLLVYSYQATDLWNVLSKLGDQIVIPVGLQALEMRRIENGVGRYGDEYSDAVNPLEGGLQPLISFDKGCYIGQEVIARLNTYDKVQRKLVGFVLDMKKRISKRQQPKVLVENREVGVLTSWVRLPRGKRWLALGYVRRTAWKIGTQVDIVTDEGTFPARVASLPFRR